MANGQPYDSYDPSIVAVGPARYGQWPMGTRLEITGPAGTIVVTRVDSCPGCHSTMLDLSEEGNRRVCGVPEHTCQITIRKAKED